MSNSSFDLEQLVAEAQACLDEPANDAPVDTATTMRERFFEILVLILANLYGKTPVAAALFDRVMLQRVTAGMDDGDSGKLATRAEDWIRLEGLVRQQDGQKAYFLTRSSLAVLSTITSRGTLGDVIDRLLKRYVDAMPTANIRRVTRAFGSYFLMQLGRS
jgi:hypothetical protein